MIDLQSLAVVLTRQPKIAWPLTCGPGISPLLPQAPKRWLNFCPLSHFPSLLSIHYGQNQKYLSSISHVMPSHAKSWAVTPSHAVFRKKGLFIFLRRCGIPAHLSCGCGIGAPFPLPCAHLCAAMSTYAHQFDPLNF